MGSLEIFLGWNTIIIIATLSYFQQGIDKLVTKSSNAYNITQYKMMESNPEKSPHPTHPDYESKTSQTLDTHERGKYIGLTGPWHTLKEINEPRSPENIRK